MILGVIPLLIATLGAGLLAVWVWTKRGRTVAAPTCAVGDIEDGIVEVEGTLEAPGLLRAPISGRRAAAWELVIELERGMFSWTTVVARSAAESLSLVDASGRVSLEADAPQLRVHGPALCGRAGPFAAPPRAVLKLLWAHGCDPRGVIFCRGFRWYERILAPGDAVRVRGVAQWTTRGSDSGAPMPARPEAAGYRRMDMQAVLRPHEGTQLHLRPAAAAASASRGRATA